MECKICDLSPKFLWVLQAAQVQEYPNITYDRFLKLFSSKFNIKGEGRIKLQLVKI